VSAVAHVFIKALMCETHLKPRCGHVSGALSVAGCGLDLSTKNRIGCAVWTVSRFLPVSGLGLDALGERFAAKWREFWTHHGRGAGGRCAGSAVGGTTESSQI
jgi:hypothetical protein